MLFGETPLKGLLEVRLERHEDNRGFFARQFCVDEYAKKGINIQLKQINISANIKKHTLRGMHYQLPPSGETRIVACIRGAVYDMSLDLRPKSTTFGQSHGTYLSSQTKQMMFIPNGFAHGYITLEDNTEFLYLNDTFYAPQLDRIIRWDDPKFSLKWPIVPSIISQRDANQFDFDPAYHLPGMDTIQV